ncbi:MAG: hypothetical protein RBU37_22085 [Myxococcota bacterium]|jgi:hypothetical protein|nr:hypothetical protein [Myxococcota bacterium]
MIKLQIPKLTVSVARDLLSRCSVDANLSRYVSNMLATMGSQPCTDDPSLILGLGPTHSPLLLKNESWQAIRQVMQAFLEWEVETSVSVASTEIAHEVETAFPPPAYEVTLADSKPTIVRVRQVPIRTAE